MNKKGIAAFQVIVGFAIFAVVMIFTSVLIYEVGKEYIINNVADAGKDAINASTTSTSIQVSQTNKINEIQTDYNNFLFPFDLFFLFTFIVAFTGSLAITFQSRKEGIFSFFGYLFIGTLVLLLVTSYLATFTSWFQSEIYGKLFADTSYSTPIFNFYLLNLGIINFIWWLILIAISVIDRNFISKSGEVEE